MSSPPLAAGQLQQNAVRSAVEPGNKPAWTGWIWVIIVGLLVLAGATALVSLVAPASNAGFASSAAALAAITASVVAIERVLEIFWTAIGLTVGSFWPLTRVHDQMQRLLTGLNAELEPVYEHAKVAISDLGKAQQWADERIAGAQREIDQLKQVLLDFQNAAPNSQRARFMISLAGQAIGDLQAKYPDIAVTTQAAKQTITIAENVLESFKDNPGRRLISIYLGALLGLAVAGVTGLDVFQATLGVVQSTKATLFPGIGVALTGLTMGLGSNPTHEIIRVLQEIKESRKADNNR